MSNWYAVQNARGEFICGEAVLSEAVEIAKEFEQEAGKMTASIVRLERIDRSDWDK